MKRKILLIPLALLLAVSLVVTGCPAAPPTAPEAEAEIAELEADIAKLESGAKSKDAQITKLQKDLAAAKKVTAPEVLKWRMQTMGERGTWFDKLHVTSFEKPLEAMSGGRIQIETFGIDEIVPAYECHAALQQGLIELVSDSPGWHSGTVPADDIDNGSPGSFRTGGDAFTFFDDFGYMEWKQKNVFDALGIKNLVIMPQCGECVWSAEPIKSLDDLKGKKIRTPGIANEILASLGASMVFVAGAEVYMAGMTGILDASTRGGFVEMEGAKLYEPFPYALFPPVYDLAIIRMLMPMDLWNTLPEDLQEILLTGMKGGALGFYTAYIENDIALARMIEEGKVKGVYTLPPEDFAKFQAAKMAQWDTISALSALDAEAVEMLMDFVKIRGYVD